MENKPEEIRTEVTQDLKNRVMMAVNVAINSKVEDSVMILRLVNKRYIRNDNTITSDAYRPRKRERELTGFEKNVSTALKSCHNSEEGLALFNSQMSKHKTYEMLAMYPNERGYDCILTHDCHVGICGDMAALSSDEDSLNTFAVNSTLVYPNT